MSRPRMAWALMLVPAALLLAGSTAVGATRLRRRRRYVRLATRRPVTV